MFDMLYSIHSPPLSYSMRLSISVAIPIFFFIFFFNDTPTTEIYTLSLHDALPISKIFSDDGFLLCFVANVCFGFEKFPTRPEIGRATSELQSRPHLVCRLLLEKKKKKHI